MRIVNLVEDTKGKSGCAAEHGLSFYIETEAHHLLMDTGASPLTWDNARRLGIDLGRVDTVVLSHGHYDHTGGLPELLKAYPDLKIYLRSNAGEYYVNRKNGGEKYIGIDPTILDAKGLVLTEGDLKIDEELSLFTNIVPHYPLARGNRVLCRKTEQGYVRDSFEHEQCLVIREKKGNVLLSGCAHNGIRNILEQYEQLYGGAPRAVISGFHLMQPDPYTETQREEIRGLGRELNKYPTVFYSGHCTGAEAFDLLKQVMGDRLRAIHSGDEICLDEE